MARGRLQHARNEIHQVVDFYEPADYGGSPYRTDGLNQPYPGFKRIAAVLGDFIFGLTRRITLEVSAKTSQMPCWSYLASNFDEFPFLGTFHTADIIGLLFDPLPSPAVNIWRKYYLNFIHTLNPNEGIQDLAEWPQWKPQQKLIRFSSPDRASRISDDFRQNAYYWILQRINRLAI